MHMTAFRDEFEKIASGTVAATAGPVVGAGIKELLLGIGGLGAMGAAGAAGATLGSKMAANSTKKAIKAKAALKNQALKEEQARLLAEAMEQKVKKEKIKNLGIGAAGGGTVGALLATLVNKRKQQ